MIFAGRALTEACRECRRTDHLCLKVAIMMGILGEGDSLDRTPHICPSFSLSETVYELCRGLFARHVLPKLLRIACDCLGRVAEHAFFRLPKNRCVFNLSICPCCVSGLNLDSQNVGKGNEKKVFARQDSCCQTSTQSHQSPQSSPLRN
jgi:hypothetical protein